MVLIADTDANEGDIILIKKTNGDEVIGFFRKRYNTVFSKKPGIVIDFISDPKKNFYETNILDEKIESIEVLKIHATEEIEG